ncbi:MAG: hypothetical protein IKV31_04085 [Paludibacteraceae bacterium]|nr:hypothetical protein [Paludibacteraceae bacterium]
MTYKLYFTLDYEIHGNGDGNPYQLLVEPTYRLMDMLECYGQRVTIMADVAEILCFKRYKEETGKDEFHVAEIEQQLCDAIHRGHDVQLHIHSSYFKAHWNGIHFDQCIEEYNMAALPHERINEMVGQCVEYLESLLKPIKADYKVWLYRAANWSMMPTPILYKVLTEFGITHDTSVYKGGCQGGNVCYDYRNAYDNLLSYPASAKDINRYDANGTLIEMPIYTEMRPFWSFISPIRVFRMIRAKFHKHKHNESASISKVQQVANKDDNRKLSLRSFFVKSALKMDFNQVNGRGLVHMMKNIMQRAKREHLDYVDVILIGHSKTFVPYNEKTLRTFLEWIGKHDEIIKK